MKHKSIITVKDFLSGDALEASTRRIPLADTYNMVTRMMKELLPYIEVRTTQGNTRLFISKDLVVAVAEATEVTNFAEEENN